jgi:hypothetical protein
VPSTQAPMGDRLQLKLSAPTAAARELRHRFVKKRVRTRLATGRRWIRTFGSWSRDRQTIMGDGTAFWKTEADLLGNRKFESTSLQRRVGLWRESGFVGQEPRLSAWVCAAGLATGSAETRRVFRYHANRRQYLCRARFQYRSAADVVGENATRSNEVLPCPSLIAR